MLFGQIPLYLFFSNKAKKSNLQEKSKYQNNCWLTSLNDRNEINVNTRIKYCWWKKIINMAKKPCSKIVTPLSKKFHEASSMPYGAYSYSSQGVLFTWQLLIVVWFEYKFEFLGFFINYFKSWAATKLDKVMLDWWC